MFSTRSVLLQQASSSSFRKRRPVKKPTEFKLLYGRQKTPLHHLQQNTSHIAHVLAATPAHMIESVMQRGLASGELDRHSLGVTLVTLRRMKRFDKALAIARLYEKSGRPLRTIHYSMLMSHATLDGSWGKALQLWNDFTARAKSDDLRLNSVMYGSLFAALRGGGLWQLAVTKYVEMMEDRVQPNPMAVHTMMHIGRHSPNWQMCFKIFAATATNAAAVDAAAARIAANTNNSNNTKAATTGGALPPPPPQKALCFDALCFKELLYALRDNAPKFGGNSWHVALSIIASSTGGGGGAAPLAANTGLFNTALEILARDSRSSTRLLPPQSSASSTAAASSSSSSSSASSVSQSRPQLWEKSLQLFAAAKNSSCITNVGTYRALSLQLFPRAQSLRIGLAILADMEKEALPPSREVFHNVIRGLLQEHGAAAVKLFAEKVIRESLRDPGNDATRLNNLYVAILDALLYHRNFEATCALLNEELDKDRARAGDPTYELDLISSLTSVVGLATNYTCESLGKASQRWIVCGRVAVVDISVLQSTLFETLLNHYDSIIVPFSTMRELCKRYDNSPRRTRQSAHLKGRLSWMHQATRSGAYKMIRVFPYVHEIDACRAAVAAAVSSAQQAAALPSKEAFPMLPPIKIRSVMAPTATAQMNATQQQQQQQRRHNTAAASPLRFVPWTNTQRAMTIAAMLQRQNADAKVHLVTAAATPNSALHANYNSDCADVTIVEFPHQLMQKAPTLEQLQHAKDELCKEIAAVGHNGASATSPQQPSVPRRDLSV